MKVTGSKVGGARRAGAGASPAAPSAGGGFSVGGAGGSREAAPAARTGGLTGVGSLDALLALQQMDGPLERRRRAVGRANRILDVLDGVKIAMLEGDLGPGALSDLMAAVRQERAATEDPRLEGVLDEIETRAAVELAKREAPPATA